MTRDNGGNLANSKGSDERDQAVPWASAPDMSTTEEVSHRKRNEALLAGINCFNIKTSGTVVAHLFVVTVWNALLVLSLLCSLAKDEAHHI